MGNYAHNANASWMAAALMLPDEALYTIVGYYPGNFLEWLGQQDSKHFQEPPIHRFRSSAKEILGLSYGCNAKTLREKVEKGPSNGFNNSTLGLLKLRELMSVIDGSHDSHTEIRMLYAIRNDKFSYLARSVQRSVFGCIGRSDDANRVWLKAAYRFVVDTGK